MIDLNPGQRQLANTSYSTRAWLACGVVAGPLYVNVTMLQALTREGFDLKHHRFTLLTSGELGWIHQLNMIVVGALTVFLAVGVSRALASGRGAIWGPRMLGAVGFAYLFGGLFVADPIVGFPPGTTAEMAQKTWQGIIQNGSRGASTLALLVTSVIIARWFSSRGYRGWAWFYGASFPMMFVTLFLVGLAIGFNGGGLAFLVTPWIWITTLAAHLLGREIGGNKQSAPQTA